MNLKSAAAIRVLRKRKGVVTVFRTWRIDCPGLQAGQVNAFQRTDIGLAEKFSSRFKVSREFYRQAIFDKSKIFISIENLRCHHHLKKLARIVQASFIKSSSETAGNFGLFAAGHQIFEIGKVLAQHIRQGFNRAKLLQGFNENGFFALFLFEFGMLL